MRGEPLRDRELDPREVCHVGPLGQATGPWSGRRRRRVGSSPRGRADEGGAPVLRAADEPAEGEDGVVKALADIANDSDQPWEPLWRKLRDTGRLHFETY